MSSNVIITATVEPGGGCFQTDVNSCLFRSRILLDVEAESSSMWKQNPPGCGVMQRLYVGGLSPTITQKDLKDRFGKFGDVEEVELRTRKDAEGQEFMNMNKYTSIVSVNLCTITKCC